MLMLKRLFCILVSLIDLFAYSHGQPIRFVNKADVHISVNRFCQQQTISGFGASACWWAQDAAYSEYADEIAEALYSKDGLGLNIYRYNIGAGEKDNPKSRLDKNSNRATESFYFFNEETGEYEYDFTRDSGAQLMLKKCLSYGCIDTVVLFANSPHFSMTATGYATGGYEEFTSNLPKENYEAYADYFLTITEYFLSEGIPVKYISPINEPQWSWSGDWVGQEGCHYEKDEAVALLKVFAKKMTEKGMTDVKLMGPESGAIDILTEQYFEELIADEDISQVLGALAYHSYWSDANTQAKIDFGNVIKEKYSDCRVDMSEWCELPCYSSIDEFSGAVTMARIISQDITLTRANSWNAWVGVNNYGIREDGKLVSDGLLVADEKFTELYTGQRYYALQHFSKFVPKGSVAISFTTDVNDLHDAKHWWDDEYDSLKFLNISAFKTPEGKIVLVIVNEGKKRNITTNLLTGHMTVWQSTAEKQMENIYDGWAVGITKIPAQSITTIVCG